jgi:hypothetical protein
VAVARASARERIRFGAEAARDDEEEGAVILKVAVGMEAIKAPPIIASSY